MVLYHFSEIMKPLSLEYSMYHFSEIMKPLSPEYSIYHFSEIMKPLSPEYSIYHFSEIMKPLSPEYSMDMPSTAGTYTRGRPDSVPTAQTTTSSRESPSFVGSEAHMVSALETCKIHLVITNPNVLLFLCFSLIQCMDYLMALKVNLPIPKLLNRS